MTGRHRNLKRKPRADYRAPSLQRTSCCDYYSSSRGIARFFCAMRVFEVRASSSPQATFVPNVVSFAASVAELAHGEKSRIHSITHSPSLFDALGSEACALEQKRKVSKLGKFSLNSEIRIWWDKFAIFCAVRCKQWIKLGLVLSNGSTKSKISNNVIVTSCFK